MKYFMLLLFLVGCSHNNKVIENIDYPLPMPPPNPPNLLPWTSPPPFTPDSEGLAEVQINPLPHPFNLNGSRPYAVWVNGERLPLSSIQIRELAHSLNLKFKQPKDTAEIHNGEGWQRPLDLTKNKSNNQDFVEEEVFIDVE